MPGNAPAEDIEAAVARIEADTVDAAPSATLAERIEALAPACAADPLLALRLLVARGTVENRLSKPGQALATLYEARRLAAAPEALPYRSRISRMIATIHAWRGKGDMAMRELLRALAEAKIAGRPDEEAMAIAEAVRACKEVKDYELALVFHQAGAALAQPDPAMRARGALDRLQILNRLGRHAESLAAADEDAAAIEAGSRRVRLLSAIEEARALAGLGRIEAARDALERARGLLSGRAGSYEQTEWTEACYEIDKAADARRPRSPAEIEAAQSTLEALAARFHADDLNEQEADKRLELAELHYRQERIEKALDQALAVVAIGARHNLPRIQERGRNAMLAFCNAYDHAASSLVSNRYVIGAPLGSGGYGEVRRGYDVETGARRAVKFIRLDGVGDTATRRMLLRDAKAEMETAGRIRHPGVLKIHSVFVDGETIVLVQDLVEGETMEGLRVDGLRPRAALRLFRDLAHALVALHEAGIIHRDLKPGNVMVDDALKPTLIDFGLSAIAGALDGGPARGSGAYAAPELLAAGPPPPPHPNQDIYALGVMMGEFLPAETGASLRGLMSFVGKGDAVSRLVASMRSRDPGRRPADMRAIASALDEAVAGAGQSSDR